VKAEVQGHLSKTLNGLQQSHSETQQRRLVFLQEITQAPGGNSSEQKFYHYDSKEITNRAYSKVPID